jgi:Na+:H+ antiporter, NhaA family
MKTVVKTVVKTILLPFQLFIRLQTVSGSFLLLATGAALVLVHTPFGDDFLHFWEEEIYLQFEGGKAEFSLLLLINDGLMTLFFVMVGLEIKREVLEGELSTPSKALLPAVAALSGMVVPALLFTLFNVGQPNHRGWGIPTATDIAFSLTVLSLLGNRVPPALKVFLAALAIVDDLGAIIVIAVFYSGTIHWLALLSGLGIFGLLLLLNRLHFNTLIPHLILGFVMWLFFVKSGIHPTISGVLFALAIPHRRRNFEPQVEATVTRLEEQLALIRSAQCRQDKMYRDEVLEEMQKTSRSMESPLQDLLHFLTPLCSYLIMPLFALANAGVVFRQDNISELTSPLALGIMAGLVLGKSTGILLAVWLSVRLGWAALPSQVSFQSLYGLAWLAGIGFTMSIFISGLALPPEEVPVAKMAILLASGFSGLIGYLWLRMSLRNFKQEPVIEAV